MTRSRTILRTLVAPALVACLGGLSLGGCATTGSTNAANNADEAQSPDAYAQDRVDRLRRAHALAIRAEGEKDPAQAAELLRQAVLIFPDNSAYWTNLGTALVRTGVGTDRLAAMEAFLEGANRDVTDPRPYYNLGLLYLNQGWSKKAIEYFDLALDRDEYYIQALRGSIRTRMYERYFTTQTLERLNRAVLIEDDEEWAFYFQAQRIRLRAMLEEEGNDDDLVPYPR